MKKIISISVKTTLLLIIAVSCSSGKTDVGAPYGNMPDSCRIEAFLSDTCGHCRHMEEYLIAKNIPYTKRNVTTDYWARQDYYALGGAGVPLLKIVLISDAVYHPYSIIFVIASSRSLTPWVAIRLSTRSS